MSEWISVNDRLPGENDSGDVRCLVFYKSEKYPEELSFVGVLGFSGTAQKFFFVGDYGEICFCENVTHWMPLPDPPEVKP